MTCIFLFHLITEATNKLESTLNKQDLIEPVGVLLMNSAFLPPIDRFQEYFSRHRKFPKELEEGNIEYKLKLDPTPTRFEHLLSQMQWRLCEYGICYYLVGVDDNGNVKCNDLSILEHSFKVLEQLAAGCSAHVLEKRIVSIPTDNGQQQLMFMQVSIGKTKQTMEEGCNFTKQINVCLVGPENAGKSTLAACIGESSSPDEFSRNGEDFLPCNLPLYQNDNNPSENLPTKDGKKHRPLGSFLLDDGRGGMRMHMLRHRHEILSGKTSSISYRYATSQLEGLIFRFIDTPGCFKYRSTLLKCLTTHKIDICLVLIASNDSSFAESWNSFFSLCNALNIQVVLVISKIDLIPTQQIGHYIESLCASNPEITFETVSTKEQDVHNFKPSTVPVLSVSCTTGKGLDLLWNLLHQFKNEYPIKNGQLIESLKEENGDNNFVSHIEGKKSIEGESMKSFNFCIEKTLHLLEGTVVYGYVKKGTIERNSGALVGPFPNGSFFPVIVRTVMQDKKFVESINEYCSGSLLIELLPSPNNNSLAYSHLNISSSISVGMVLVDDSQISCGKYKTFSTFECHLLTIPFALLTKPITGSVLIRGNYHDCILTICSKEDQIDNESANDKKKMSLFEIQLISHKVYVRPGDKIYFSTGNISAIGSVERVLSSEN